MCVAPACATAAACGSENTVVQNVSTPSSASARNAPRPYAVHGILMITWSDMLVKERLTSSNSSVEWPSTSTTTGLSVMSRYRWTTPRSCPYFFTMSLSTTVLVTMPAAPRSIHGFRSSGSPASQMAGPRPLRRASITGPVTTGSTPFALIFAFVAMNSLPQAGITSVACP